MLLSANDEVVLSDFGIAVVQHSLDSLSTQSQAGTPVYMAPEQIEGHPCAASDQYALGVVVYEWSCGRSPKTPQRALPRSRTLLRSSKKCVRPPRGSRCVCPRNGSHQSRFLR